MTVSVFAALLLIGVGISIAEFYHAWQRAILRALQGKMPYRPFPRPVPQLKVKPIRMKWWQRRYPRLWIREEIQAYPTPAAIKTELKQPSHVVPLEAWVRLEKDRKVTARRKAGEWRVG